VTLVLPARPRYAARHAQATTEGIDGAEDEGASSNGGEERTPGRLTVRGRRSAAVAAIVAAILAAVTTSPDAMGDHGC